MMKNRAIPFSVSIAVVSFLVACRPAPTPFPTATPIAIAATPTPTSEPTQLPTPTPTPTSGLTLPVLAGTPVPLPTEPITPENVDQIQQLAIWGKGQIEQVAYSPDGKVLAVGTTAGVWLYEAETLTELHFLNTGNFVGTLAFSSDNQRLIVDVGASTITIWNVETGELLSSLRIRDGYQGNINASPVHSTLSTGAKLLAAILDERSIGIWETETGKQVGALEVELASFSDTINNLSFSHDQTLLAITTKNKNTIQLLNVDTGRNVHILEGSADQIITGLNFSSSENKDEMMLASGGTDQKIWLWNVQTGTSIHILEDPAIFGGILTFSPDGNFLASSSVQRSSSSDTSDWNIHLWRVSDGKLLKTLTGHTNTIKSLVFSPDNKLLISGSDDGTVRLWNIETGELADMLDGFGSTLGSLGSVSKESLPAFPSNDQIFISNPFNDEIELWEMSTGHLIRTLAGHTSRITNLMISTDGSTLASTELWDYSVRIWDTATGQSLNVFEAYVDTGYAKYLAISPDGELVAVGDSRAWGRMYRTQTGEMLYVLPGGDQEIRNVLFSPDGTKLAFGSGRFNLTIVDTETSEVLHDLKTGPFALGMAFSPDNKMIAVGTQEGVIELWDVATGEQVDTLSLDDRQILTVAFSPDGRLLAAGVRDRQLRLGSLTPTVQLWDVQTGSFLSSLGGHNANVSDVTFSPGGTLLAITSFDGTMRLWGVPPE